MTINNRTVASIKADVTAVATKEGEFRDGVNDIIDQVDDNQVKLARVTDADLDKLNDVTATASDINKLALFDGTGNDLDRATTLNDAGFGTNGQVLTTNGSDAYSWTDKSSYSFVLEDSDGTEVTINEDNEVKFLGDGTIDVNWTNTSPGTDSDPYEMTWSIANGAISTAKLADDAVTGAKIASSTITNDNIVNGTVKEEKLDVIAAPGNAEVLSWNAANARMEWVENSGGDGDTILVNTAVPDVSGGAISSNSQSITIPSGTQFWTLEVFGATSGNVGVSGAGASENVEANIIPAGSVGSTELATNAVTNAKVANDAIGVAELSASGSASSSTYLRGDNTWSSISTVPQFHNRSSNVSLNPGNPSANQVRTSSGTTLATFSSSTEAVYVPNVNWTATVGGTNSQSQVKLQARLGSGSWTDITDTRAAGGNPSQTITDESDDYFVVGSGGGNFQVRGYIQGGQFGNYGVSITLNNLKALGVDSI